MMFGHLCAFLHFETTAEATGGKHGKTTPKRPKPPTTSPTAPEQDDVNFVELARSTDDFNGAQLKVEKFWGFQGLKMPAQQHQHQQCQ